MIIDPTTLRRGEMYKLLISIVIPRPIALVSTVSSGGVYNIAPFSFFNGISSDPPLIFLGISKRKGVKKDTSQNIEDTGNFVVNMVDENLAEAMNLCSGDYPPSVDEFKVANLTPVSSMKITAPRIGESPVNLECELHQVVQVKDLDDSMVIGKIVLIHVKDIIYMDGELDPLRYGLIGRLGLNKYCYIREILEMVRPEINPENYSKD